VGKSTLFNRLIRQKKSIVDEKAGVTRDRLYGEVHWQKHRFTLADTGGLLPQNKDKLVQEIKRQVNLAVEEAELILLVVDGKEGLHPLDEEISQLLRKSGKSILLLVNKIDGLSKEELIFDFYRLGFSEAIPLSAAHGLNVGKLLDKITQNIPAPGTKPEDLPRPCKIMVAGHPNVGKSTLINTLLKEERVLVDEKPGTTRDIVEIPFRWKGEDFILLDSAGIRRESKIKESLEKVSVKKTKNRVREADIVLLLLDLAWGITREDLSIGSLLMEEARGIVVLLNKCDLIEPLQEGEYLRAARKALLFFNFAPFVLTSGLTGKHLNSAFKAVKTVFNYQNSWMNKEELQEAFRALKIRRPPRRDTKLYSLTQVSTSPVVFSLITNNPKGITAPYLRYIKKYLHSKFVLEGIPLKIKVTTKKKNKK